MVDQAHEDRGSRGARPWLAVLLAPFALATGMLVLLAAVVPFVGAGWGGLRTGGFLLVTLVFVAPLFLWLAGAVAAALGPGGGRVPRLHWRGVQAMAVLYGVAGVILLGRLAWQAVGGQAFGGHGGASVPPTVAMLVGVAWLFGLSRWLRARHNA